MRHHKDRDHDAAGGSGSVRRVSPRRQRLPGGAIRRAARRGRARRKMRAALLTRLIPPQQQLFTTLEPSSYRPSLIGVVVADVFAFRAALGPGAALQATLSTTWPIGKRALR